MSYEKLSSLPVYRKALELCHLSREIASYVTFNKDLLHLCKSNSLRDHIADSLLTDTILIPKKIALATTSENHSDRLKSAAFINIILRNISSYCRGLEKDGVKEKEYLNLLRKEIRLFRKSYRSWRNSFGDGHGH